MIEEIKENNRVVEFYYKYLNKFVDIYPKDNNLDGFYYINEMPDRVKITVYCEINGDDGFLVNLYKDELGIDASIARKWIIHSELEKLIGCLL